MEVAFQAEGMAQVEVGSWGKAGSVRVPEVPVLPAFPSIPVLLLPYSYQAHSSSLCTLPQELLPRKPYPKPTWAVRAPSLWAVLHGLAPPPHPSLCVAALGLKQSPMSYKQFGECKSSSFQAAILPLRP